MSSRSTSLGLILLMAAGAGAGTPPASAPANPKIDAPQFLRLADEAIRLRASRRLSEEEFLRAAAEPATIVLDARSRDKYEAFHVRGALSLPFTDFTAANLARVLPTPGTRVLIYCNNNFEGAEEPFPTKMAPAALNLSTFVALYTYGYRNVWELAPLLDVRTTRLPFAGTAAADRGKPQAPGSRQ
jgi:phage shock protein E